MTYCPITAVNDVLNVRDGPATERATQRQFGPDLLGGRMSWLSFRICIIPPSVGVSLEIIFKTPDILVANDLPNVDI